jgi:hypothetical protein
MKNFKFQALTSREAPKTKHQFSSNHIGRAGLELEAWNFSGAWRLELGASA